MNVNFVGRQAGAQRDEAMPAYVEALFAAPQEQVEHLEECRMAVCLDAIRRIKERGVTGVEAAGSLSSPAARRSGKRTAASGEALAAPAAKKARCSKGPPQLGAAVRLPAAAAELCWGSTGKRSARNAAEAADGQRGPAESRPLKRTAATPAEADAAPNAKRARRATVKKAAAVGPSGPSAKPRRTGKAVGQGAPAGRGDRINEAPCLGLLMLLQACRTNLDELEA